MNPSAPPRPDPVGALALAARCAEASAAGARILLLDLAGCADKAGLLDRAALAFELPAWFGHNWDALADSLGDLSWIGAPGYLLVLGRWQAFAAAQPGLWDTLCEILAEAAQIHRDAGTNWHVVCVEAGT